MRYAPISQPEGLKKGEPKNQLRFSPFALSGSNRGASELAEQGDVGRMMARMVSAVGAKTSYCPYRRHHASLYVGRVFFTLIEYIFDMQ
jgi:hypothetical protein